MTVPFSRLMLYGGLITSLAYVWRTRGGNLNRTFTQIYRDNLVARRAPDYKSNSITRTLGVLTLVFYAAAVIGMVHGDGP